MGVYKPCFYPTSDVLSHDICLDRLLCSRVYFETQPCVFVAFGVLLFYSELFFLAEISDKMKSYKMYYEKRVKKNDITMDPKKIRKQIK